MDEDAMCGIVYFSKDGSFVSNTCSQQETALFIDAFSHANIGMAIVSMDGHWLKVNRFLCDLFGCTEAEMLSDKFQSVIEREHILEINAVHQLEQHTKAERKYIRKDGQEFWALCNTTLVKNENSRPSYFIIQIQDITEQKRVKEQLQTKLGKFERLAEALPWGIMVFNEEGIVLHANKKAGEIYQLAVGQLSGISLETHPLTFFRENGSYMALEQLPWAVTLRTQEPVCDQVIGFVLPNTETRWLLINTHYSYSGLTHNNKQVMVIMADITCRKETEDLCRKAERLSAVAELGAGVAHEIRNPLTTIKGFIQLLQATNGGTTEYLEIMLEELERIEVIVSEFTVLAKPHVVVYERRNLQVVLQSAFPFVRRLAAQSRVKITSKFPVNAPDVYCEESQLKQAFVNIMKNAIEATADGGTLFVEVVRPNNTEVVIRFVDHGCGIADEIVRSVGEPFFTTKEHGTGLGLLVSRKVIQDHRGSLTIKSKAGRGTTVEVTLPVC